MFIKGIVLCRPQCYMNCTNQGAACIVDFRRDIRSTPSPSSSPHQSLKAPLHRLSRYWRYDSLCSRDPLAPVPTRRVERAETLDWLALEQESIWNQEENHEYKTCFFFQDSVPNKIHQVIIVKPDAFWEKRKSDAGIKKEQSHLGYEVIWKLFGINRVKASDYKLYKPNRNLLVNFWYFSLKRGNESARKKTLETDKNNIMAV